MRLLVVEDEEVMAEALAMGLRRAGYATDIAVDGAQGLELTEYNSYDVIVLDRDLPRIHGDDVCKTLISRGYPARILMLTASARTDDKVDGLNIGADDYLTKPFMFKELLARINALGRRSGVSRSAVRTVNDVTIDTDRIVAWRGEQPLDLSLKEFWVLVELVEADHGVVSAEQLLEKVWDENADPFTNAVRVTMVGLRRKLGNPPLIRTIRGCGYQLHSADEVQT